MARVVIDGQKFLLCLGLDEDTVTPMAIREALSKLNEAEIIAIRDECVIDIQDTLPAQPTLMPSIFDWRPQNMYVPVQEFESEYTETQLRRMIKYEKNPMRKQQLQKELSSLNMYGGKHRKGKKR